MADEMEAWLEEEAADGFNVVCNHYPKPFEDFCRLVVPELHRRGIFRTEYEGTTLRENFGLRVPENRYTPQARLALATEAPCGSSRFRQRPDSPRSAGRQRPFPQP